MGRVLADERSVDQVEILGFTGARLPAALLTGAAALVLGLYVGLSVWAVLGGWSAYFTRGTSLRDRAYNIACAVTGLGLTIVAQALADKLNPGLGAAALPVTWFLLAISVQLMQWITGVKNIPSYFLGCAVAFAASVETSLDSYLMLTAAIVAGAFVAALPDMVRPVPEDKL
ncbi:DUF1097 domain-containing protein [Microbulbifer thermotolerans]|uniref:DUF1097 domain-containing protein n=1 Tax=Microbulbifer thermotolerans TaxID=252514 RepID=UPI0022487E9F|nr:DUF1097 domain-containing protein [Microbulbifer thermotolerans]MCX2830222.1 DUF1097 domain-containing protein [Microbulbifer thermotolerans]